MAAHLLSGTQFDAVVVGGGFYGCTIAAHLSRRRGLGRVLLVERGPTLLGRASLNNQARVHNGYHYPRSFTTAYRSRVNLPRFVQSWPAAVRRNFTKVYAIARSNSKVNARQFCRFCRQIGAPLEPADAPLRQLFNARMIEDVFIAQEYAFDAAVLADWAASELAACNVEARLQTEATAIERRGSFGLSVRLQAAGAAAQGVSTRYVLNCAYSGLNRLAGGFTGTRSQLKHEITEMALVEPPAALASLGITVMDGPFFSLMPFPTRGLHTLSHVRFTPHGAWADRRDTDPYAVLDAYRRDTRYDRMLRDAARYLPGIVDARYRDSLYEIKTVLTKSEGDDGRPIVFESHPELPGCWSVLGGKIDNVFDVLERLDDHDFDR